MGKAIKKIIKLIFQLIGTVADIGSMLLKNVIVPLAKMFTSLVNSLILILLSMIQTLADSVKDSVGDIGDAKTKGSKKSKSKDESEGNRDEGEDISGPGKNMGYE